MWGNYNLNFFLILLVDFYDFMILTEGIQWNLKNTKDGPK